MSRHRPNRWKSWIVLFVWVTFVTLDTDILTATKNPPDGRAFLADIAACISVRLLQRRYLLVKMAKFA